MPPVPGARDPEAEAIANVMEHPSEVRERTWKQIQSEPFDLVVVGGGITGAGIFRDAALRGLKVALFERDDFASGTSSRSSKLVHGGLRYLEMFQFGLVFESTHERARLMRLARNLVRPLPFLLPVFRSSRNGLVKITAGMWLYDLLASFRNYRMHRVMGQRSLLAREPSLRRDGLRGGVLYYDAMTDDARLTLDTILDGLGAGGVALNRVEVTGLHLRDGRVKSIEVLDRTAGRTAEVATGCVVCAAGPWTESVLARLGAAETGPRLRPTKGAHIVLPRERLPLAHAVVMSSPVDGRVMFAIPWRGATVVGTTDTDFPADPSRMDRVFADRADVEYLLASIHHYFPEVAVGIDDVIGTWAGLRPLIDPRSDRRQRPLGPSQVSREHEITVDPRGIVTVAGGKLTTYRLMAAETLAHARAFLPDAARGRARTGRTPLPSSRNLRNDKDLDGLVTEVTRRFQVTPESAAHLVFNYGSNTPKIIAEYSDDSRGLLEPLVPGLPVLRLEAVHAARNEMALTVADFLCRRTPIFFLTRQHRLEAAREAADLMGDVLGWNQERKGIEITAIEALSLDHEAFRLESGPSAQASPTVPQGSGRPEA